jgi:hypothetical protein
LSARSVHEWRSRVGYGCASATVRDLEPGNRLPQFFGRLRQLAHHLRSGAGAFAGLLGHGEDVLDVGGHHVGRIGFLQGLLGDALDQLGQLPRHAVDVAQRRAGRVGELRPATIRVCILMCQNSFQN